MKKKYKKKENLLLLRARILITMRSEMKLTK